MYIINTTEL